MITKNLKIIYNYCNKKSNENKPWQKIEWENIMVSCKNLLTLVKTEKIKAKKKRKNRKPKLISEEEFDSIVNGYKYENNRKR